MKKMMSVMLTMVLLLAAITPAAYATEEISMDDITFGNTTVYDPVLTSTNVVRCAVTVQDGHPIALTVVPGTPCSILNVVDLTVGKRIAEFDLKSDTSTAWEMETDSNGDVWFGTYYKCHMYKYSPKTKELTDFGSPLGESAVIALTFDEEDNLYIGTYPSAKIIKINGETGAMADYGTMKSGEQYVYSLGVYKDKFYYSCANDTSLYEYDPATQKSTLIPFAENGISGVAKTGLYVRDNYLVCAGTNGELQCYDLESKTWSKKINANWMGNVVSPVLGGKIYYTNGKCLAALQLSDMTITELEDMAFASYMRGPATINGMVELDDPEMPGLSYVTTQYAGTIYAFNFQSRKIKEYTDTLKGVASDTREYTFGPDGRLYVGEYMGTKAAAMDINTGAVELFHMAQPEGIAVLGDKMYFGNYTGSTLYILDTTKKYYRTSDPNDPNNNPRIWGSTGAHMDRPWAMLAAGDKIAMGGVPDYGILGGALTIYDPETDKCDVYENLVKDQSFIGMAYKDGKLYLTTTVSGGLGISPTQSQAKVLIFDMETRKVTLEKDFTVPGISPIMGVESISVAPDNTLVGYGRGYIYKLDIETLELLDYEIYNKSATYGNGMQIWDPYKISYDEKTGYAFICLDGKLAILDPITLDYKTTDLDFSTNGELGPDGNLWYLGSNLPVKIPVIRGDDKSYLLAGNNFMAVDNTKAYINGMETTIDAPYKTAAGTIMISAKLAAQLCGYMVSENNLAGQIILYNGKTKIKIRANERDIYDNSQMLRAVSAFEAKNGEVYISTGLVRELLHTEVYTTEDGLVVMGDKAASAAQSEETLNYARQLLSAQSADVSSEQ